MHVNASQIRRRRPRHRSGLAPLEFVLWLPILLFVMALMVNFGTSAAWRLRGEIASRDAVWGQRHPRSESQPPPNWPVDAAYEIQDDSQIELLDDPELDHEVVRGPQMGQLDVNDTLDPDREGAIKGVAQIERAFPLLPRIGRYESGPIEQRMLETMWQCHEQGYSNPFRRATLLYEWPDSSYQGAYDSAAGAAESYVRSQWDALDIMYKLAPDCIRYRQWLSNSRRPFHPRPNRLCETDPQVVREDAVEPLLNRITSLPQRMTNDLLNMYEGRKRYLENLIEQLQQIMPQTSDIQQRINAMQDEIDNYLNPRIDELTSFQGQL